MKQGKSCAGMLRMNTSIRTMSSAGTQTESWSAAWKPGNRMNIPELQAYRDFTQPFSGDYAEKLQKLSEEAHLSDCKACIDFMLTHKIRLEQEAMLT